MIVLTKIASPITNINNYLKIYSKLKSSFLKIKKNIINPKKNLTAFKEKKMLALSIILKNKLKIRYEITVTKKIISPTVYR